MRELVDYNLNKCPKCAQFDCLIPYKGSVEAREDPDNLYCTCCGEVFAIDLDNSLRQMAPLINTEKLTRFVSKFTGGV